VPPAVTSGNRSKPKVCPVHVGRPLTVSPASVKCNLLYFVSPGSYRLH